MQSSSSSSFKPQDLDENLDSPVEEVLTPPVNPELEKKFAEFFRNRPRPPIAPIGKLNEARFIPVSEIRPVQGPTGFQIDENFARHLLNKKQDIASVPIAPPPPPDWLKIVIMMGGAGMGILFALIVKFGISGLYDYLFKTDPVKSLPQENLDNVE